MPPRRRLHNLHQGRMRRAEPLLDELHHGQLGDLPTRSSSTLTTSTSPATQGTSDSGIFRPAAPPGPPSTTSRMPAQTNKTTQTSTARTARRSPASYPSAKPAAIPTWSTTPATPQARRPHYAYDGADSDNVTYYAGAGNYYRQAPTLDPERGRAGQTRAPLRPGLV